jgi:hypothetical protein
MFFLHFCMLVQHACPCTSDPVHNFPVCMSCMPISAVNAAPTDGGGDTTTGLSQAIDNIRGGRRLSQEVSVQLGTSVWKSVTACAGSINTIQAISNASCLPTSPYSTPHL